MIVLKKKNLIVISVLLVTFLTFIFCFSALAKTSADGAYSYKIKIVLDAGHGGVDGGVCGVNTGVKESDLNLAVVKKLERLLISADFNVVLTRNSSAGLYGVATNNLKRKDMQKRRDIIKSAQPNLVVSIHMNKYSLSTRRGAQVFFKKDDDKGKMLAINLQESLNSMENASRKCDALVGDYYILNCTDYPSVIAECGFLSNAQDESLLITDDYQEQLAYAIYKGIVAYLSQATIIK